MLQICIGLAGYAEYVFVAAFMTTNLSAANAKPYSPGASSDPPMFSLDSVRNIP
jgi:hypothetical protein